MIPDAVVATLLRATPQTVQDNLPLVIGALKDEGIYSKYVLIAALATIGVEVRGFLPIEEKASGEAYEMRRILGNVNPGDGVRFKGRGWPQLTGRYNYTKYSKRIGVDLVEHPELLLTVDISARVLAAYFKDTKIPAQANIGNAFEVRALVNGRNKATGEPNGLKPFLALWSALEAAWVDDAAA